MGEPNALAAYCVDNAVRVFGVMVENALQEREKTGAGKDATWKQKYELAQLLEPSFTLPRPQPAPKAAPAQNGLRALMALARQKGSGVKLWGVKPS